MPYISSKDRNQIMMVSFEQLVPEHSIARIIDKFVDSLDLAELGFTNTNISSEGRPAYPPAALLKLYIYGYKKSIRSSRKLREACLVNIEVRWMLSFLEPDHRTISDFRKNNKDCMKKVFYEFNKLFSSHLMNGFVSVDGSKFAANNSKDKNFTATKLDDRIQWLEGHVEEYLRQMEQNDDELLEGQFSKDELEARIKEAEARLELYRKYRSEMETKGLSQLSLSDEDAKLMKMRNGFGVAHNVQTAVDSETHMIVDFRATSNPTDYGEILETLKDQKAENPEKIINAVADKGYQSEEDMIRCLENGIIPNVIPNDGQDTYTLETAYQEAACDPDRTDPEEIRKCLHAGVIPKVYEGTIRKITVEDKKTFITDPDVPAAKSPFCSETEMREKAADGYFVRDPERNLVICPAGNILRQNQVTRTGLIRYINKLACRNCPHRNKCHGNKKGFKEIEFSKDQFVKPCNKWLNIEGKKSDVKPVRRKSSIRKVVTIIFCPDREKMAQRMCLSEHPFGTIKRSMGADYFLLRGHAKVEGEFALLSLGYNLQRAISMFGFEKLMGIISQAAYFLFKITFSLWNICFI